MRLIFAVLQCDATVPDVHRQPLTAWADHEGWFGVVMVDIGWHVGSPTRHSVMIPDSKTSIRLRGAAIIMTSSEHRGNDRAFPAHVTNLHDRQTRTTRADAGGDDMNRRARRSDMGTFRHVDLLTHMVSAIDCRCARSVPEECGGEFRGGPCPAQAVLSRMQGVVRR